jgi:hypothetical protein
MIDYHFFSDFPAIGKLDTFTKLPVGWHYGAGGPISQNVIATAKQLIRTLGAQGFTRTDAFANEDGEVLVTAYHRSHYLGIGVGLAGSFTFNHEIDGHEAFYQEHMPLNELTEELSKVSKSIWITSDLSTPPNTTTTSVNSTTWHLRNPQVGVECQSSNWIARPQTAA